MGAGLGLDEVGEELFEGVVTAGSGGAAAPAFGTAGWISAASAGSTGGSSPALFDPVSERIACGPGPAGTGAFRAGTLVAGGISGGAFSIALSLGDAIGRGGKAPMEAISSGFGVLWCRSCAPTDEPPAGDMLTAELAEDAPHGTSEIATLIVG